jgi:hypothetical protein
MTPTTTAMPMAMPAVGFSVAGLSVPFGVWLPSSVYVPTVPTAARNVYWPLASPR